MKKTGVLLLGDSIRLGYQHQVIKMLGDDFVVCCPEENCRFAKYMLNGLKDYLTQFSVQRGESFEVENCGEEVYDAPSCAGDYNMKYLPDVIHWNCGLWDTAIVCREDGAFTPIDEYINYCSKILRELRKITPNIIFATTTPVKDGSANQINSIIKEYNKAITEYMNGEGVVINDLYSVVDEDTNKYIRSDCIHLSDEGKKVCAKAVSNLIKYMCN